MSGSPGGQEIGRVSVKVVPDTSDFDKQRLERRINREMKDAKVHVTIEVDVDKTALRKLRDDLKDWAKRTSPLKVHVKPELQAGSTTLINQRLNYASRARTVPILPYLVPGAVNKVSAGMGTMLAAMSGGRVIKTIVGDFGDWLKTLDKAAPKMALVTQGLVGIVGLGLTAGSNLFALSSSLASIGAVALTLPATFASAAIGVGVLWAAFKDFNTVLPDVKTRLSELQNLISGNFWAKAKAPFQEMIADLFPKFSDGLAGVSTQLGGFFGSLATGFGDALGPSVGGMFKQLADSITIAQGAAGPLTATIATLGTIGASYLPKMAQWVVDTATEFNNWLSTAATDGSLKTWVDNGLAALSDLGQVLKNVYTIFSGIGEAATLAGGSSLGMVAETLKGISDAVNNPAFQGALVQTLRGAHEAMSAIATTSGPAVKGFFETLGSTLGALLPVAGAAIGTLLSELATAFSNPEFITGFTNLISGMADMLAGLGPAIGPIAAMFGALGSVLGQFLSNMGPVIGSVFGTLATVFAAILPALQPVISVLTGGLLAAFQAIAPVISLVGSLLGSLISGSILPALSTAIGALVPVLTTLAPLLMDVLFQAFKAIAPLLPMLADAFASVVPLIGQLIGAVLPLVSALLPALAAILAAVIPIIVEIAQAVLPPVIKAITALVAAIVPVIAIIAQLVVWLLEKLAPVFTFLAGVVGDFIAGFIGNFTAVFESIMGIFDGFKTMFSGGWSNFFLGLWQIVSNVFTMIWNVVMIALNVTIIGAVGKFFGLVKALFKNGWEWIKLLTSVGWDVIKSLPAKAFALMKGVITGGLGGIKNLFSTAMMNLQMAAGLGWSLVKQAFAKGVTAAIDLVKSLPQRVKDGLGDLGNLLKDAAAKLIGGFVAGIQAKFGDVKDTLQNLTKKLTDWKGPESLDRVLLVEAGQLIIQGLINGMESRYDGVRRSLQGLTSDIGATVVASPQIADMSGSYASVNAALQQGAGAASTGGNTYEINVPMQPSDSSPEDVADAILFAQKRFAYGSAYAI